MHTRIVVGPTFPRYFAESPIIIPFVNLEVFSFLHTKTGS